MTKITQTLQIALGAAAALILAPFVAVFGLMVMGFAIGAAALMTGIMSAVIWFAARTMEDEEGAQASDEAPDVQGAQPAL